MQADDFIELAVVTSPHGVKGRVKVKSFTEPPEAFAEYEGLRDAMGNVLEYRVTGEAPHGQFILEIGGLGDRNLAETWRGKKLGVLRDQLKPIVDDDRFYVNDLIGMSVVSEDGAPFGEVIDVQNFGAGDILEIRMANGNTQMFSFTNPTFPAIDKALRRITIAPPEFIGTRQEEGAEDS